MAKYWKGKILENLANDSQFDKILPTQNLPLKYLECRAEVICQFITTKSVVSKCFTPLIFCHVQYSILCLCFMLSCLYVYHAYNSVCALPLLCFIYVSTL